MNKVLWLVFGVAIGFVVAHQVNQTKEGRRFFEELNHKTKEFSDSVVDGYREREAELRTVIGDAGDTLKSQH